MDTKICSKCGKELPREAFHKNNRAKDGLQYYCKACLNEALKESRKRRTAKVVQPKETPSVEVEHMHKVYTHKDLARFTPRELMLELKARGYVGELLFVEVIRKEHRINIGKLE